MLCNVCGIELEKEMKFCSNCGAKLEKQIELFDGFLSYRRSTDGVLAKWIKLMLEKIGNKNIFLDLDNINKGRFDEKILDVIENSNNFLLILSKGSVDKCINKGDWVTIEISHALKNKKNIIPILVEDFKFPPDEDLTDEILRISRYNGVQFNLTHSDSAVRKLLSFMINSSNKNENYIDLNSKKHRYDYELGNHKSDLTGDTKPKTFSNSARSLNVATSGLVVVDAFIYGSKLEDLCNDESLPVRFLNINWSQTVLDKLSIAKLDFAIYNENESRNYIKTHPESGLTIYKRICYSMGGKSFSIIVAANSELINVSNKDLLKKLKGKNVYIGINSDRFINFCEILNISPIDAKKSGIHFIDIPDPSSLSVLDENPNSVLVGGQNIRFAAYKDNRYCEIVNYDNVSEKSKKFLRSASSNCIVYSKSLQDKLNISCDTFFDNLINNFNNLHNDSDFKENLINHLEIACDLPDNLNNHHDIINHILFETYRIGEPKF
ncbi:TIR domain-containing protein [uncultured Lutibacter sp.]|uniref:TIR domain-containing protein n=1 Tax=uncultured Lutibacter sp. TaxID=437739 RepID=UPI00260BA3BD|nr:TIR domain-containing protein [uncultured Lutibacter sp.]